MEAEHNRAAKLRGPVQQCLKDHCQAAPGTPSRIVQQALQNRCGIVVSISHLNATRAALGLGSRATPLREKPEANLDIEPQCREGAGGLLLLVAVQETDLLLSMAELEQRWHLRRGSTGRAAAASCRLEHNPQAWFS